MINPAYDPVPDALRDQWQATRNIRVDDLLQPEVPIAVLAALREVPHRLMPPTGMEFQMAMHENFPDADCDHTLCKLTRWWYAEGLDWVRDLTGLELEGTQSLVSTLHGKGGYLDPHNDKATTRRLAYVLGFTELQWPWQEGGYLEFLRMHDGELEVVERRAPGFNTLDLFDVQHHDVVHRISMLTEHHERRVVVGWFHSPASALPATPPTPEPAG